MAEQLPPAAGGSGQHPAPISEEDRALFVEFLVSARRRSGRSLDEIRLITKVPPRHLEALERGQVEFLPGGLYRRAIVRNYARAVGLDPVIALERFSQIFGAEAVLPEWQGIPGIPMTPPPAGVLRQAMALAPVAGRLTSFRSLASPVLALPTLPKMREQLRPLALAAAISIAVVITAHFLLEAMRTSPDSAAPSIASGVQTTTAGTTAPGARRDAVERSASAAQTPVAHAAANASLAVRPVSTSLDADGAQPRATVGPDTSGSEFRLVITSQPTGARVTVNGIGWGVTPITVRHLPAGDKLVRVTKDGYVGQERQVRLGEEGGTHAVALTLQRRR